MRGSSGPPEWAWRLSGAFILLMGIIGVSLSVARLVSKGDLEGIFYIISSSVAITLGATLVLIGDPWKGANHD